MPTVLIVDDDDDIRALAAHALSFAGYDTAQAGDGAQALDQLADGALPDLVLLDVQMPRTDGWEALAAIRANPRTSALRVVFATVKTHVDDQLRGWRMGCDGYLTKPYDLDDLHQTVAATIARGTEDRTQHRRDQIRALTSADSAL